MKNNQRVFEPVARLAALWALAGMWVLAACTSQEVLRKADLATLAVQLPGNYDNPQQTLSIQRVSAPLVGDHVFYVRESAANDARRVISERIWSLDLEGGDKMIAAVYTLDEPDRWHAGAASPEVFQSLLLRDLHLVPGCQLEWQKTAQGFGAEAASARCPQRWRLEGESLAFSDHAPARAGAAADAATDASDALFHFVRRGGAP